MFWRHLFSDDIRSWRGLWQASLVCACIALSLTATSVAPVLAYDERQNLGRTDGNEAVLGTFRLRGPDPIRDDDTVAPKRSGQDEDDGGPDTSRYSTADLMHMFADARAANEEGDVDEAQRLFERVIAARPNSALADAARKDLATLYRGAGRKKQQPSVRRRARVTPSPSRRVYGPTRPREHQAPSRQQERKQRSRRLVMLERQFIADVGDRIFFAKGSAQLGARARAVLMGQADWLKAHPDIVITIEGHADDGAAARSESHNLSLARAESVRQALMREGIAETRIASVGRGRANPIATCSNASCAAQNRRVVTVISSEPIRIVGESDARTEDGATGRRTRTSPNRSLAP